MKTEFIYELPVATNPWKMTMFGDVAVFINPDHPAHVIKNGVMTILKFEQEEHAWPKQVFTESEGAG
jgi:hypothetical protein